MYTDLRRLFFVAVLALPPLVSTCNSSSEPAKVATSIVLTPAGPLTLAALGRTQQFAAAVKDQNGGTMSAAVTWSSSNTSAVSVGTSSGLATAVANGTAQVTATSGSATHSASVTVAQAGAQITKVSGDAQSATVSQSLGLPLVVQVADSTAHPAVGVTVAFAIATGAGSVGTASAVTNAGGQAQSSWTLGGTAGSQTVTATVTGATGSPLTFTATAQPANGPANVVAFAGGNGPGLVGYGVNVRPAVRVTDIGGLAVPGATVNFVAAGGGSGTNLNRATNSNGVAQVGSWVLGVVAGTNAMTATVTGAGIAGNPVTFTATGYAAGYDIQVQYFGPPPEATIQAAMNAAVAKWESIIYRPVGATPINIPAGACGTGTPALNTTVQNLLILAKFDSIDGPGKILGQAGPCYVRSISGFALVGVMMFDTADVATMITNNTLNSVMLHEMGHVIGFGTVWNEVPNSCLQLPDTIPGGTIHDTYFSCAKARAAFDSIGGTSYTGAGQTAGGNKVPVENCGNLPYVSPTCGGGTVNGHWRETVFGNELMTGFINLGTNPLSLLTIAAQEDLGYVVNYAAADAYVHIFTAPAVGGAPPIAMGDDIRHGPIYVIDASGKVVRVLPAR